MPRERKRRVLGRNRPQRTLGLGGLAGFCILAAACLGIKYHMHDIQINTKPVLLELMQPKFGRIPFQAATTTNPQTLPRPRNHLPRGPKDAYLVFVDTQINTTSLHDNVVPCPSLQCALQFLLSYHKSPFMFSVYPSNFVIKSFESW